MLLRMACICGARHCRNHLTDARETRNVIIQGLRMEGSWKTLSLQEAPLCPRQALA